MFVRCAWHKKNFGESLYMGMKEPLSDTSTTDGICPICLFIMMIEELVLKIEKNTKKLVRAKELI